MPELDAAMLADFHSAATDLRALAVVAERQGRSDKAARYKRISEVLDGIAYRVRDPLLVEIWEHTGAGNTRVQNSRTLERRVVAELACHLLRKNDGLSLNEACRIVGEAVGERRETLRKRFKGLSISDYERSKNGRRTAVVFQSLLLQRFPKGATWRQMYDFLIDTLKLGYPPTP